MRMRRAFPQRTSEHRREYSVFPFRFFFSACFLLRVKSKPPPRYQQWGTDSPYWDGLSVLGVNVVSTILTFLPWRPLPSLDRLCLFLQSAPRTAPGLLVRSRANHAWSLLAALISLSALGSALPGALVGRTVYQRGHDGANGNRSDPQPAYQLLPTSGWLMRKAKPRRPQRPLNFAKGRHGKYSGESRRSPAGGVRPSTSQLPLALTRYSMAFSAWYNWPFPVSEYPRSEIDWRRSIVSKNIIHSCPKTARRPRLSKTCSALRARW
ncbi:uncharacterized protein EI97DRAFT_270662 [Westerdykella ornata]|uniref:Uncharacterized protein n=1 Tax=Westerdykella ornata TaxID=318751 RepID=A0A6A6JMG1_WESOR|nr:uncharacterized protein EI97DRAFT_270662 [Westerdykella ornata]KAF2277697.1 hypothetical protein EI97DRAFT_270662 [Westerdykella ornata]